MSTFIGKGAHKTIRWAALLIALTVTAASLLQAANIKPTFATGTGNYPWYNAVCVWTGLTSGSCTDYDWGETTCPSGDGFCTPSNQITTSYGTFYKFAQWGEWFRNCTSYAAWMLSTTNGFTMPFSDDAANWGTDAGNLTNSTPAAGSIFWDKPNDHVAYVVSVSSDGSSVTIEDYNADTEGDFSSPHSVSTRSATGYIHFKDLTTSASDFQPFTGNFNGDGYGDIGLRRISTGMFYFKHGPSFTDQSTYDWAPGAGTDFQAFTGNFNGDGYWDIGLRNINTGMFYMKHGTSFIDQFTYQWASG